MREGGTRQYRVGGRRVRKDLGRTVGIDWIYPMGRGGQSAVMSRDAS